MAAAGCSARPATLVYTRGAYGVLGTALHFAIAMQALLSSTCMICTLGPAGWRLLARIRSQAAAAMQGGGRRCRSIKLAAAGGESEAGRAARPRVLGLTGAATCFHARGEAHLCGEVRVASTLAPVYSRPVRGCNKPPATHVIQPTGSRQAAAGAGNGRFLHADGRPAPLCCRRHALRRWPCRSRAAQGPIRGACTGAHTGARTEGPYAPPSGLQHLCAASTTAAARYGPQPPVLAAAWKQHMRGMHGGPSAVGVSNCRIAQERVSVGLCVWGVV